MLSLGVPMILMGDEVRQTQRGNNNAYCQDNELSWLDWNLLKKHADVHRFFTLLAERRLLRGNEHEKRRRSLNQIIRDANKAWHGTRLNQPDWSDHSRSIAFTAELAERKLFFHMLFNAYWEPLDFDLPPGFAWQRWIDTGLPSPQDISPWDHAPAAEGKTYRAEARSVVALYALLP
jgi:glycogen operon protein